MFGSNTIARAAISISLLSCAFSTAMAASDELAFRREVEMQVAFPYEDSDIDKEDAKIANLRDNKLRTPSGLWQLMLYYEMLAKFACSWHPPGR